MWQNIIISTVCCYLTRICATNTSGTLKEHSPQNLLLLFLLRQFHSQMTLKFSKGNAKLGTHTLIFNLPAGKTCPGAMYCKSFAVIDENGKRKIQDGEHTEFRCFAATSEAQYDAPYYNRKANLETIVEYLRVSVDHAAEQISVALNHHRTRKTELVRIHESGDFFSLAYLQAWVKVAQMNPDLKFYCYSKSLPMFVDFGIANLPDNFYLTASYGGAFDSLIDAGMFPRYSKVVMTDDDANSLGLEVDHDDTHCFGNKPFALLVHSTQPKGSEWGKAIRARRKANKFSGYSKGKKPVAA